FRLRSDHPARHAPPGVDQWSWNEPGGVRVAVRTHRDSECAGVCPVDSFRRARHRRKSSGRLSVCRPRSDAGTRRGSMRLTVVGVILTAAVMAAGCAREPAPKVALHQLYTPHFDPPPPSEPALVSLRKWIEQIGTPAKPSERPAMLPNQAGVLWLSLAIVVAVGLDFRNRRNPRNVDLVLMQLAGWLFFNILVFTNHLQNPTVRNVMDWIFVAIVAV